MYPYLGTFFLPIYSYGVLLSLGFLAGILLAIYNAKYFTLTANDILDLAFWFMLSSIIGARALYIILFPNQFPTVLSWFEINKGGLVFFGGFFPTIIVVVVYSKIRKIPLSYLGDMIAPSLVLGHFLGRIGCFLNGCCYGKPTNSVFGIQFPILQENFARHPTQLYEAIFLFVLFWIILWAVPKLQSDRRLFRGIIWGFYLVSYGVFRFFIEFLRDDQRGGFFTPLNLSISQLISLLAIFIGIIWLIWYKNRSKCSADSTTIQ